MSIANAEKGRKIMPDGNQPDSQNAEGGTPAEGKKFYMRSTDVPPAEYDRRWNKAFDPNVKPQETSMGSDQTAQPVTEAEVLTPESKRPGPGVLEGTRTQARINGAEELKPQTREEFFKGKFNNDFPDIDRQKASSETTAKFEHLTPEQTKEKAWEDGRAERKRIDEVIANALKNPQKEEPSMRAEDTVPILEKINQEKKAAAAETKTKAYYGYMLEALDKNPIKTPSEASNQPKAYMDYMIKNANAGKGESGKPVDAAAKKVQPPVITPGIEIAKVTTSTPEKKTTTSASAQKAAEVTAPASEVKTDLSTATSVPEIPTYESMVLPIMNKAGDRVLVEVEKTTAPLPEGDLRAILDKKAAEEIEAIEKAKAGAPAPAEAGEATEQTGADNKIDLKSNPDLVKKLQEETSRRGRLTDAQRYIVVRDWLLDQTGLRMKTNVLGGEEPFLWKNKDGKEDYVRDANGNPIKFPLTYRTPQLTAEGVVNSQKEPSLLKFLENQSRGDKEPKETASAPQQAPEELAAAWDKAGKAWVEALKNHKKALSEYEPYKAASDKWILEEEDYKQEIAHSGKTEGDFLSTDEGSKRREAHLAVLQEMAKAENDFNATDLGKKLLDESNKLYAAREAVGKAYKRVAQPQTTAEAVIPTAPGEHGQQKTGKAKGKEFWRKFLEGDEKTPEQTAKDQKWSPARIKAKLQELLDADKNIPPEKIPKLVEQLKNLFKKQEKTPEQIAKDKQRKLDKEQKKAEATERKAAKKKAKTPVEDWKVRKTPYGPGHKFERTPFEFEKQKPEIPEESLRDKDEPLKVSKKTRQLAEEQVKDVVSQASSLLREGKTREAEALLTEYAYTSGEIMREKIRNIGYRAADRLRDAVDKLSTLGRKKGGSLGKRTTKYGSGHKFKREPFDFETRKGKKRIEAQERETKRKEDKERKAEAKRLAGEKRAARSEEKKAQKQTEKTNKEKAKMERKTAKEQAKRQRKQEDLEHVKATLKHVDEIRRGSIMPGDKDIYVKNFLKDNGFSGNAVRKMTDREAISKVREIVVTNSTPEELNEMVNGLSSERKQEYDNQAEKILAQAIDGGKTEEEQATALLEHQRNFLKQV